MFDVGGNVGDFAAAAHDAWPKARVVSFEPAQVMATRNHSRANGRWRVEQVACSNLDGEGWLNFCETQHSASSMEEPGSVRRELFGINDSYIPIPIRCVRLDDYLGDVTGPLLVKVDVEGHERQVLSGAPLVLDIADTVVCEVQHDPQVFPDASSALELDIAFRSHGLVFAGIWDALKAPDGRVVQFDGIWRRLR